MTAGTIQPFGQSSGQPSGQTANQTSALIRWLMVVAALVVTIVVVGGITRLTESGLSITQWKPISGIIPPLNDAQWEAEFAGYRQIPQYAVMNAGMALGEFKAIFFWEYIHRVLGRVIGMAVALPLAWFALRRAIPAGFGARLVSLLALVGVQGLLGWLMVRSGLSVRTEVAPLWLAAHLITALSLLFMLVWTICDLRDFARRDRQANGQTGARLTKARLAKARLAGFGLVTIAVLAVQLVYGALMAGLRAGKVTDQWPLMNGQFYPGVTQTGQSALHVLTADPAIVHFIHRWLAWVVVGLLVVMARRLKRRGARRAAIAIHSAFGTQILLGIATVMTGVSLWIAVMHQLVGALLVIATAWGTHELGRRP